MEYVALGTIVFVSIILPVIIMAGILWKLKENGLRNGLLILTGVLHYLLFQWGIKEHGLQWLFNHAGLHEFMEAHYLFYLLLVALVGACLFYVVSYVIFNFFLKCNYRMGEIVLYGFSYCTCEAVLLSGITSINTIIQLAKGVGEPYTVNTSELFLSAYERVLIFILEIGLLVVLSYFVQQGKKLFGTGLTVFCGTLVGFLPGFFIAFSTKDFLEIYSRNVAYILIYLLLSFAAITSIVVIYSLRFSFHENCTKKNSKNIKK